MSEQGKTYRMSVPVVAPFGCEVTRGMVQEVWDAYVKPTQSDDAAPQSGETRVLMGILRAVYDALPATGDDDD